MPLSQSGSSFIRQFRRAPIYSFAAATSLVVGIAAICATFAVVKRAFLDALPFADPDRLVSLHTVAGGRELGLSFFVAEDLRTSPLFTDIASFRYTTVTYQTAAAAERVGAVEVTPSYFTVLGVAPAAGAAWANDDADAVVVSWGFFERALGAAASRIGSRISVDGRARTVTGVMPRGFVPPFAPDNDLWTPLNTRALLADTARARRTVRAIARLRADASLAAADAFMKVFSERTPGLKIDARDTWIVRPLRDDLVGQSRPALVGTAVAAVLLLLIVWTNIAGLSVAQAAADRRAIAVRRALGATSARLLRERFVDSLALATIGSTAGIWLSYAIVTVAARYQSQFLGDIAPISLEPATVAVGLALGIVSGIIAAVAPQHVAARLDGDDPLRAGQRMTADRGLGRIRSALVLAQVAVAIVLMISAGLLVRTVYNLSSVALGFESETLTTFTVNLPTPRYQRSATQIAFERDVLERLRQIPSIAAATASVGFPAVQTQFARLTILDRPDADVPREIAYFSVAPAFFSFLQVPIKQGRDVAETDDEPAPRVVVINETMARRYWPDGGALGARVKIGAGAVTDREITVVGVVADVRQNGPTQDVRPTAYGSTLQYSWPFRTFGVRTAAAVPTLAAELRTAIHAVDSQIGMEAIRSFDDQLSQQTARHRLVMGILSAFAAVAAVLCGFGLYAVVALTAQFRRREFAIRLAIGARRGDVQWIVVRQAIVLAAGGAAIGIGAAMFLTNTLQGLLHGVEPVDRAAFSAAVAAVIALATLAASLPAWRAGRIDPVETLRAD